MRKRIIYTRPDGGVSICSPAQECIDTMSRGGAWDDRPRGYVEVQIERQIADGIPADAAMRFARAMAFGGLTEAEALAVIRDRDCRGGLAIELWDVEDVPPDRWFRGAWRRSHNGGPISIDMKLARPIQFRRIRQAVNAENEARKDDIELFGIPLLELNWGQIRDQIMSAQDEDDLRRVWPEALNAAKA